MNWQPYPETILETPLGGLKVEVSIPTRWHVVMGASGKPEHEVHQDFLVSQNIPLYKRKGGGGTVLLGPGTIVVTVHAGVRHLYRNKDYFNAVNRALIGVFQTWKDLDYQLKGLSDIAVGERKIVGSSLFRRRQYLLYQASILFDLDLAIMTAALKPPPRQPDYRRDRGHGAFVTSLLEMGVEGPLEVLAENLSETLPALVRQGLDNVDRFPGK